MTGRRLQPDMRDAQKAGVGEILKSECRRATLKVEKLSGG